MTIENAKIENVTVYFEQNTHSVFMILNDAPFCFECCFTLTDSADTNRLAKLMEYTKARNISDLNNNTIRLAFFQSKIQGFGHNSDDKFVPAFTKEFMELTLSEFDKMLKNS